MGMDAEILAICPFSLAQKLDILEYPEGHYEGAFPNSSIIVTVAQAYTTDESQELARLVLVEPWQLWKHRVHKTLDPTILLADDPIGGERPEIIARKIEHLLVHQCHVWFRPNG